MFEEKVSKVQFDKFEDKIESKLRLLEEDHNNLSKRFWALCNHLKLETVWDENSPYTNIIVQHKRPDLVLINGKWEIKK